VKDVRLRADQIVHIGKLEGQDFQVGEAVRLSIDKEQRCRNARLHSGGHLVDIALTNIGQTQLKPGKGHHFPVGSYVEYEGNIPTDKKEHIQKALESEMERLIKEGSDVKVTMADYSQIAELCGSAPSYLPKDKPARIVTLYGKIGCPCGGTHVKNIKEIGTVKIGKITVKSGQTRIRYDVL